MVEDQAMSWGGMSNGSMEAGSDVGKSVRLQRSGHGKLESCGPGLQTATWVNGFPIQYPGILSLSEKGQQTTTFAVLSLGALKLGAIQVQQSLALPTSPSTYSRSLAQGAPY